MAGRARKAREKEERKKKKRAEKDRRKAEYESKIRLGTNSKRKQIAKRKGIGKIVKDHKSRPPEFYRYIPPSRYSGLFS